MESAMKPARKIDLLVVLMLAACGRPLATDSPYPASTAVAPSAAPTASPAPATPDAPTAPSPAPTPTSPDVSTSPTSATRCDGGANWNLSALGSGFEALEGRRVWLSAVEFPTTTSKVVVL